jgi:hypothetical protein
MWAGDGGRREKMLIAIFLLNCSSCCQYRY